MFTFLKHPLFTFIGKYLIYIIWTVISWHLLCFLSVSLYIYIYKCRLEFLSTHTHTKTPNECHISLEANIRARDSRYRPIYDVVRLCTHLLHAATSTSCVYSIPSEQRLIFIVNILCNYMHFHAFSIFNVDIYGFGVSIPNMKPHSK